MQPFSSISSRPITLSRSAEAQVYGLFALAMGLTVVGVFIGMQYAMQILSSGFLLGFVLAELAIILTANWWKEQTPLNYLLFGLFPVFSGITITPLLVMVLTGYANGPAILVNALATTTLVSLAAAVVALGMGINLSGLGRGLFFGILGLMIFGVIQLFVPALQVGAAELLFSGAGVVLFALFTAYDIQRVSTMARSGANPFLMALSLYLDIFNLFLFILRFMLALSGQRR